MLVAVRHFPAEETRREGPTAFDTAVSDTRKRLCDGRRTVPRRDCWRGSISNPMSNKNTPASTGMTADGITIELTAKDARAICAEFGYVPTFELLPGSVEDWGGALHGYPLFYYPVRCDLHTGGVHVGQGNGSCSNWEKKYRYRGGERTCPQCGAAAIIKGKPEYERDPEYKRRGAWLCFERRGGCGAKYFGDDPAITKQDTGRVDNPDFADLVHVVRKMADKRALISAVLNTPGYAELAAGRRTAAPVPPPLPRAEDDRALTGAEWRAQQPTLGQLKAEADQKAALLGQHAGTKAAADAMAQQKLANLRKGPSSFPKFEAPTVRASHRLPANLDRIKEMFELVRKQISASEFAAAIAAVAGPGCHQLSDLEKLSDMQMAYDRMLSVAEKKGVAA